MKKMEKIAAPTNMPSNSIRRNDELFSSFDSSYSAELILNVTYCDWVNPVIITVFK